MQPARGLAQAFMPQLSDEFPALSGPIAPLGVPRTHGKGSVQPISPPALGQHNVLDRALRSFGQPMYDATVAGINNQETPYTGWNLFTEGPMGPFGMARAPARIPNPIRAYHGSPHQFDEFRMDRIGTGEGSQLEAHGLFFSESEPFARPYRMIGTGTPGSNERLNTWINRHGIDGAIERIRREVSEFERGRYRGSAQHRSWQQSLDDAERFRANPPGHMYEVNLNVSPDRQIDWNLPLSQQGQAVQRALSGQRDLNGTGSLGSQLSLRDQLGPEFSSSMVDQGIAGIRYRDNGVTNHIMFDPSLIEILRRYGIAAPVAGGAAASSLMGDMEQ